MLFHRSLISFVAAMAMASSVTAFAVQNCGTGTGSLTCCGSYTLFSELSSGDQNLFAALDPNLEITLSVGQNCAAPGSQGCTDHALCCNGITVNQGDLVNAADNCVRPL
ncbi:hypothetical protein EI94DRAFT_1746491 [Lactarius quietus]|nr:hypothetical protein EI94DRAFT_1746491 [Lactarius quietus]